MNFDDLIEKACENTTSTTTLTTTPAFPFSTTPPTTTQTTTVCPSVPPPVFSPPDGSALLFPSSVAILGVPGATVRYTSDGSVPDCNSPVYTGPVNVVSEETVINAIACLGCNCSSVAVGARYRHDTRFDAFNFYCDEADDFVGQWGDYTPNGVPDYHFRLELDFPVPTDLDRVEIGLLAANGTTLSFYWATNSPINPWPPVGPFLPWPLAAVQGGIQLNLANGRPVGNFNGPVVFDLYGSSDAYNITGAEFIHLRAFFGDGASIERIIPAACETTTTPTTTTGPTTTGPTTTTLTTTAACCGPSLMVYPVNPAFCIAISNSANAHKAFDGDPATLWGSGYDPADIPQWLRYQFAAATEAGCYSIAPYGPALRTAPKDWLLQGSNNGVDWTTIDTVTGFTNWGTPGSPNTAVFGIDTPGSYTFYRLYVTAAQQHVPPTTLAIVEIVLRGECSLSLMNNDNLLLMNDDNLLLMS